MTGVHRRVVLKSIAAVSALGLTDGAAAAAAEAAPAILTRPRILLRIATPAPDRTSGIADDAHRFCRLTERLSQGRIRFLSTATLEDPIKLLQAGDVDAVFGYEHAKVHLHPAFAYFAGLPGTRSLGFLETHAWLQPGAPGQGAQNLWDELSADFGFRSYLVGHTASPATLWSAGPITGLAAFTGQTLAVPGLSAEVVKGLGGSPLAQSQSSLHQALKGEICAAEAAGLSEIFDNCHDLKSTFVTRSPFARYGSSISLTLAGRYCETSCADVLMTAINQLCTDAVDRTAERRSNENLLLQMAIQRFAIPYALNAEIESTIQRVTDAVLADIAGFDGHARKICGSIETCVDALKLGSITRVREIR